MTRSLCLHPHEVCGLLDGTVTLIARPMKWQPSFTCDGTWYPVHPDQLNHHGVRTACHYANIDHFTKGVAADFAPFKPSDTLVGKEAWAEVDWFDGTSNEPVKKVLYKADKPSRQEWRPEAGDRWRSPVTMPAWASRIRLKVVSVRAEQVDGKWCWLYEVKREEP